MNRSLREKVIPEFRRVCRLRKQPPIAITGWRRPNGQLSDATFDFGPPSISRVLLANTTDEVVHFLASRDAKAQPLNGSRSYVIHFPANKLPQSAVNSYSSVILVGIPDLSACVQDPLNRFTLDSHSPLQNEADGSLKIAIGPKPVAGFLNRTGCLRRRANRSR